MKNRVRRKMQMKAINTFLDEADINYTKRLLRAHFFDYLLVNHNALPIDFEKQLHLLTVLFCFLDAIENH